MRTLLEVWVLLRNATAPESIFGDLSELHKSYRRLALEVHPDVHFKLAANRTKAEEAFKLLQKWYTQALRRVELGIYGQPNAMETVRITSGKTVYTLTERLSQGDVSEIYLGESDGAKFAVKVVRSSSNNVVLLNEAKVLRRIHDSDVGKLKCAVHVAKLHNSFQLVEGKSRRQVNALYYLPAVSMTEVHSAYPGGIDPRDAAWMFNRLLAGLVATHQAGIVHGAVTPDHCLLDISMHNGLLVGWGAAVENGGTVGLISPRWRHLYAPEILSKSPAFPGSDLYMAAQCMFYLLGNVEIPRLMRGLLRSCLLHGKHRPRDVYALFEEFQVVLEKSFGPKKFREFKMPNKPGGTNHG